MQMFIHSALIKLPTQLKNPINLAFIGGFQRPTIDVGSATNKHGKLECWTRLLEGVVSLDIFTIMWEVKFVN